MFFIPNPAFSSLWINKEEHYKYVFLKINQSIFYLLKSVRFTREGNMRIWKRGRRLDRSSFISSLGRDFVKFGLLEKAEIIGGYVEIIGFSLLVVKR